MPYGNTLHIPPTNLLLLAAKQQSYKKAYLLTKILKNFLGKVQKNGPAGRKKRKDKTERVIGLGRRTRQEIVKWNQMTARPEIPNRRETSDIPGLPSEVLPNKH